MVKKADDSEVSLGQLPLIPSPPYIFRGPIIKARYMYNPLQKMLAVHNERSEFKEGGCLDDILHTLQR